MSRPEGGHMCAGVIIHARWHAARGATCSGSAIVCGRGGAGARTCASGVLVDLMVKVSARNSERGSQDTMHT
eukprot:5749914-Prymnesium_polylepis.2